MRVNEKRRKKPIKGVLKSRLPPWATRTHSYWETIWGTTQNCPKQRQGIFIFQIPSIRSWELLRRIFTVWYSQPTLHKLQKKDPLLREVGWLWQDSMGMCGNSECWTGMVRAPTMYDEVGPSFMGIYLQCFFWRWCLSQKSNLIITIAGILRHKKKWYVLGRET